MTMFRILKSLVAGTALSLVASTAFADGMARRF